MIILILIFYNDGIEAIYETFIDKFSFENKIYKWYYNGGELNIYKIINNIIIIMIKNNK